ncbi:MAG: DUF4038 domain-containing protein [Verrucomicrobiota bacterium]|nr:DUF4038 domain-containing protein [Verrucomicrobiota bacterium]
MQTQPTAAPLWQEIELCFNASTTSANPYTEVQAWVDFTHEDGTLLRRPAFWDGGSVFRVRFASTRSEGRWFWRSFANNRDGGLHGQTGELKACAANSPKPNCFYKHGFWRMSPGKRNLVHADGTPLLLCADTAWGLPWRATQEQAIVYARDRQAKGYNAALLMTVQPDMDCRGPRSRTEDLGFEIGFEDLHEGKLTQPNAGYFQYLDQLIATLVEHEIAPVYQPVFHGYGWKGRRVAGNVVSAEDYSRFCRYLVARYGARPAIWLIGGDGPCTEPFVVNQVDAAGEEVEQWDAYGQPTGIHYSPHAENRTHQGRTWLDFQWCQTGHSGEHVQERVADMWRNSPAKAVANGEPTYEEIGWPGNGANWWQGHEAWANLCAGSTMGLVYGAGSLWQWRLHKDEPDHGEWCTARNAGWREALDFPGSKYPGIARRIFDGLPFADMEPNWWFIIGRRGLSVPGKLFITYCETGGGVSCYNTDAIPSAYRIYDPKTGEILKAGIRKAEEKYINLGTLEPRVVVFSVTYSG